MLSEKATNELRGVYLRAASAGLMAIGIAAGLAFIGQPAETFAQPGAVYTQSWATIYADGRIEADWAKMRQCAETPVPKTDNAGFDEFCWRTITNCRMVINGRHVGWVDAGGAPDELTHAPTAINLPDDFKRRKGDETGSSCW